MFQGDYAGWLLEANDLPQARIYLTEAMALSARHRCLWQLCSPLVILAIVNAREGEIATAARQLGAIEEILKRSGLELSAHFAQRYERLADLVRFRLSRDDLEALRAEGRTDPIRVMADAGEAFISSAPSQAKRSTGPFALTPRERDVLRGLVRGASDKEIAAELGIGVRTVGTHVTAIRAKLSATSRSAAAAIAVHEHLV
jgi:DNA-binding NarL/FixJ family response regulator